MTQVIWTAHALSDLESIKNYLTEHAAAVADDYLTRLLFSTRKLEQFPEIGSILDSHMTPPNPTDFISSISHHLPHQCGPRFHPARLSF